MNKYSLKQKSTQFSLSVVIPTYNEVENIGALIEALYKLPLQNLKVIVVDDNSPDGTGREVDSLAERYNRVGGNTGQTRLSAIHRPQKGGLGNAYIAGMSKALDRGADYIVQMDADFSHSPDYIPQMLGVSLATGADVVIGSRYVPGGSVDEGWSIWRRFVSWWANLYTRLILGLRIRDMTSGFKLWRSTALNEIGLEKVRSNGYSFQVEMAYLSEKFRFGIIEIPIHFQDRRIGHSKLDMGVKLESAWQTWEIRWRYRKLAVEKRRRKTDLGEWPLSGQKTSLPTKPHS